LVKARNSILLHPLYVVATGPTSNYDILPTAQQMAPPPPPAADVARVVAAGFTVAEAQAALVAAHNSVDSAITALSSRRPARPGVSPFAVSNGGKRCTVGGPGGPLHGAFGITDDQNVNCKSYMEDGFCAVPNLTPTAAFFAVYDGHSGREAVDFIQLQLHNNLLQGLQAGISVVEAFTNAYRVTDQQLAEMEIMKAGSTSVTALITMEGNTRVLHVANAGDARAVLCKGGKAQRLSFDHKVEVESETARIEAAGGVILWGRVQGQTMVSRSLGDHDLKKFVISDPFYHKQALHPTMGDFLIIACDGIWDVFSDQQAVDVVRGGTDPQAMSAKLVDAAIAAKCKDNITAMIVML
jgi:serine/threonine protein phosphatase PrpC